MTTTGNASNHEQEREMSERKSEKTHHPKPDHDDDAQFIAPLSDEAKEIEEKGEPEGGGNFA